MLEKMVAAVDGKGRWRWSGLIRVRLRLRGDYIDSDNGYGLIGLRVWV